MTTDTVAESFDKTWENPKMTTTKRKARAIKCPPLGTDYDEPQGVGRPRVRTEDIVFPDSEKGLGPQLRKLRVLSEFGYRSTHPKKAYDSRKHIDRNGDHHLFVFDEVALIQTENQALEMISDAAKALNRIALINIKEVKKPGSKPLMTQGEFWTMTPTIYDGLVMFADVERDTEGGYKVAVTHTLRLALECLITKMHFDAISDKVMAYDRRRRNLNGDIIPAVVPNLYFIDNQTKRVFKLSDIFRNALLVDTKDSSVTSKLTFLGNRLPVVESINGFEGRLMLTSMGLERLAAYCGCNTHLSLLSIRRAQRLIDGLHSSLVGVQTFINLSGIVEIWGLTVSAAITRPSRIYKKHNCPYCNPMIPIKP
ncbi:MAG: hypothetical protein WCO09_02910 [bacterium]